MESNRITTDSMADLIFHVRWKSRFASHTDGYQARHVNIWRDILPQGLLETLIDKETGDRLEVPAESVGAGIVFDPRDVQQIGSHQFDRKHGQGTASEPRVGRFYPKGLLQGITGIFRADVQPFRCVGLNNGHMIVDFNHPLAGKALQLTAHVGKVGPKAAERGGTSVDWMETLTSGPGIQARWQEQGTDFFSDDAFHRTDDAADAIFYEQPRYVHHLDDTARGVIADTYGRFVTNGMRVLDLMSSWASHLPTQLRPDKLVGLGLNGDELRSNAQLDEYRIHDLNQTALLPFESDAFDAVINTASVEYLTDPLAVFKEVSRILRPDGFFIVTFSNRWFPTKAVRIWTELHEFERMGLVLEYFIRSGGFKDLQTYSMRGLPRPRHDKYFPELVYSDPVYAVWGRKRAR